MTAPLGYLLHVAVQVARNAVASWPRGGVLVNVLAIGPCRGFCCHLRADARRRLRGLASAARRGVCGEMDQAAMAVRDGGSGARLRGAGLHPGGAFQAGGRRSKASVSPTGGQGTCHRRQGTDRRMHVLGGPGGPTRHPFGQPVARCNATRRDATGRGSRGSGTARRHGPSWAVYRGS